MADLPEATVTLKNGGFDGVVDVEERDESRL